MCWSEPRVGLQHVHPTFITGVLWLALSALSDGEVEFLIESLFWLRLYR